MKANKVYKVEYPMWKKVTVEEELEELDHPKRA